MATLRETLIAGRGEVFEAFSEFEKSATYVAPGSYDPGTGSVADPAGVTVTGFVLPYEQRTVEASGGRIRIDDVKYLIAAIAELEAALTWDSSQISMDSSQVTWDAVNTSPGVMKPQAGGRIENLDGANYSIINPSDMGSDGIIWELQLRRAGG